MGASNYGQFKFLLPEFSQIIFSPGPLVYKLRQGLKNFKKKLLINGGYDVNKSEREIMFDREIYRIYDCGNIRWEWK